MLASTQGRGRDARGRRQACLVAYGASSHGGKLQAGLLVVLDNVPVGTYTLRDPKTKSEVRIKLPAEYANASERRYYAQVALDLE